MNGERVLVLGASGFLGSHVTRQLVEAGYHVRVMVRRTSKLRAIDGLDVDYHYGDVFDDDAVRSAMSGCDVVFYCVVDTRAWLRDAAPLFRTNVEGLRRVLDIAADAGLRRFVFTSSIATIGRRDDGSRATEADACNWAHLGGPYVESRVAAEQLVFDYCRDRHLPAVVLCVANTYGPDDWGSTPHGKLVDAAAHGRAVAYVAELAAEAVGIHDAALALCLAADKGRVGERYIISERFIGNREIFDIAADATGARKPMVRIPLFVARLLGACGDLWATVFRRDVLLTSVSVRLSYVMSPMDHTKATRELGWEPGPVPDSIRAAALFYRDRRRARALARSRT